MRVMQVMAGAAVGGIETFYFDAVLALADAGLEQLAVVRPIMHGGLEQLRARGVKHATVDFSSWWPWPTRNALEKAVAEFKPDIVQYWTGRAASYAPKTSAVQVGWYGGYRQKADYRTCTDFIGITPDLMRHIRDQGVADTHARLIHIFAEPCQAVPVDRASLATPPDAPLLLALSRLHRVKGLDVLLEAMARLPDAYLWIAGEGPDRDKLVAQTLSFDLASRVRFLGWRTDREALLAAADICVFPSRDEPFGAVMIEAWAADRPLVAAAAQGPSAYVESGENGMLVPVDDPQSLADAVRSLINDAALRASVVAGGRRTFEHHFTKDIYVAEMLALYRELTTRTTRPAKAPAEQT